MSPSQVGNCTMSWVHKSPLVLYTDYHKFSIFLDMSKALVTKVRTNDEFVRISQFLRIPAFVDIRRGGHSFLRSSYEVRTAAAQFARAT